MSESRRDQNSIPSLLGASNVDGLTPIPVYVDPITHELFVKMSSDIQIGAVEIKDGTSDTRAVVGEDGLQVEIKKAVLATNAATESKQDSQITLATALNALVTALNAKTLTEDSVYKVLQEIRDAIAMPPDYVEATNTKAISGAVTVSGSLTTLATLTNQTNIGSYSADMIAENNSYQDWGLSVRSLLV